MIYRNRVKYLSSLFTCHVYSQNSKGNLTSFSKDGKGEHNGGSRD